MFKVGSIFSFKDFPNTHDTLAMIVRKQYTEEDGYNYLLHVIENNVEFWVNDFDLKHELDAEEWSMEYEPE